MQKKKKRLQISNKIKLSNTVRMTIVLFAVAIIAFNSGKLLMNFMSKTEVVTESKEVYKYSNNFSEETHINLKENNYVQEDEILDGQTYLSDLISTIDFKMNYEYKDSQPTDLEYSYKVETTIKSIFSNTKGSYDVLNKTEVIKEQEETKGNSKNLKINETINIDYAKYHQIVKNFKQDMGINLDSYLYVKLIVNTKTKIGSQVVENEYTSNYGITLGDKVAVVEENSIPETTDSVTDETKTKRFTNLSFKTVLIRIVFMLIGLGMLREVLTKTEKLNTIRNEYKLELNRILKSCENKLVQIEDMRQIDLENATRVKDIYQLLKLSDEALVPIYCYIREDPEEAYFIVNKYERSYIYILRR